MNFSLNSLISELFKLYKPHVTRKKIKFKIHDTTGGTDYIVSGDEQKVYQVMSNLISNALKFTSTGTIEIGYKILKDAVRFHCKDTGIGISEDVQLKIFERFRQASFSHTKDHGGTGLGLSIAKGLVELMGGEIWFRSTVNKGSVFYFTIPYIPKANLIIPAGSSITGKTMEVEWSDKTFLVAEDEDLNYKYLYKILKKTKVNVIRVTTGREALDTALSNDRIDCILMDVKMPEMNGFEATKAIKAIKKNIPIIIVTAYALSGERELAFSSGCSDYLAKPYSDVDLINAIAKWM
jgi:CheY-like chemotaxis protein